MSYQTSQHEFEDEDLTGDEKIEQPFVDALTDEDNMEDEDEEEFYDFDPRDYDEPQEYDEPADWDYPDSDLWNEY